MQAVIGYVVAIFNECELGGEVELFPSERIKKGDFHILSHCDHPFMTRPTTSPPFCLRQVDFPLLAGGRVWKIPSYHYRLSNIPPTSTRERAFFQYWHWDVSQTKHSLGEWNSMTCTLRPSCQHWRGSIPSGSQRGRQDHGATQTTHALSRCSWKYCWYELCTTQLVKTTNQKIKEIWFKSDVATSEHTIQYDWGYKRSHAWYNTWTMKHHSCKNWNRSLIQFNESH